MNRLFNVFAAVTALGLAGCSLLQPGPQVAVKNGDLQGVYIDGIAAFKGVPYAAPPIGELRWRAPQPSANWTGVRSARSYAPHCAQPFSAVAGFKQSPISEDCLTLNVWSPDVVSPEPLPVMVWIHGGGYSVGSGNKERVNSVPLASEGVVLVTVNYRLSVFGFLTHPSLRPVDSDEHYGNYGLQDVIASLRWVQKNIAAFGGDPERVTIFGESAGAGIVNTLLVVPEAEGLFHGAVSQSSSVGISPVPYPARRAGFLQPTEKLSVEFGERLGANSAMTDAEVAAAMRSVPMADVIAETSDRERYTPVIDGKLVPDQVGTLMAAGKHHSVPYITGGNSWEASLGRDVGGPFSPQAFARLMTDKQKSDLYPGLDGDALADAIFGDLVVLSASRYMARSMRASGAPVYTYYLSYLASDRRGVQPGVAHEEDIAFIMQTIETESDIKRVSPSDRAVSQLMSRYWAQFARTGDPNLPDQPDWPAFDVQDYGSLEIGDEVTARTGLFSDRLDFHIDRGLNLLRRATR